MIIGDCDYVSVQDSLVQIFTVKRDADKKHRLCRDDCPKRYVSVAMKVQYFLKFLWTGGSVGQVILSLRGVLKFLPVCVEQVILVFEAVEQVILVSFRSEQVILVGFRSR